MYLKPDARRHSLLPVGIERFRLLSRWVLPGADHPGFRMTGDFTQTEPALVAQEPGIAHSEQGGEIVSPVFDWLEAAKELGLLAECRQKVEQAEIPDTEFQKRARASLLSLLSLEQENEAAANADFESLRSLFKTQTPIGIEDQWPETLVAVRGASVFENRACVWELISELYWNRAVVGRPPNVELWRTHITAHFSRLQFQRQTRDDAARQSPLTLKDWIPVVATRSEMSGPGYPVPYWSRQDDGILKLAGQKEDYLFYRLPLSGDFEVECNHVQPISNHSLIMIAGRGLCFGDLKQVLVGKFGEGLTREPIEPPLTYFEHSVRYRSVMRDGTCSVFFNGRLVHTDVRERPRDPWIAIRSYSFHQSHVQDLRISGRPEVLTYVPLSTSKDLTGWIDYYKEWRTGENGRWTHLDDVDSSGWIVGPRDTRLAGVFKESLLQYQRPLLEDESIEYEFFHEPGKIETNPALNRLAFILHPQGIREHWLTDGRYDRTDVAPDNVTDASECRRGPALLPLKPDQWNHLKLTRHQGTTTVELNDQLVYERQLESVNPSTFGLFHYADMTESRVRNVVMRGGWSKTLPPTSDQELASKATNFIDADLPRLKSVFKHDFRKDGLPDKYFKRPLNDPEMKASVTPEGIEVVHSASGNSNVADISPHFALFGDFDVETKFSQLKFEPQNRNTAILFGVRFDEPQKPFFAMNRICAIPERNVCCASRDFALPSGDRTWLAKEIACDSVSGRFRLARRKNKFFYLFADGDSEIFQLIDIQPVPEVGIQRNELLLRSEGVGTGRSRVVWENLILRAERMIWYPEIDQPLQATAQLLQANGKGLKTVARPVDVGFTSVGFPSWSSDGHKIAMEMSKGPKATSHIVVVNVEGGQFADLGSGCMPSFSQDGTKLVFSQPGKGIITMNSDGTNRRSIDPTGWGSQWSPNGKWIAYGKAGNITLLDVETRKSRQLLVGEAATHYGYIYAGLEWSHDSRAIAFKARLRDVLQDELVIAELDVAIGSKVLHPDASNINPDCAFSPDDQQVLVSIENTETQEMQLHAINRKQPDKIQRYSHQPPGTRVTGCAWSPDGTMIVLVGKAGNGPREWSTNSDDR